VKIQHNSLVTLDYVMNDGEGNRLNPEGEPLVYLHGGYGYVFARIEEALEGREAGDAVVLELSPEEAFGAFDPELVVEEALEELPEELCVGMEIDGYLEAHPDDVILYTVTAIENGRAVLDANHPLAGKALRFEATVREIEQLDDAAVQKILEHRDHHHH